MLFNRKKSKFDDQLQEQMQMLRQRLGVNEEFRSLTNIPVDFKSKEPSEFHCYSGSGNSDVMMVTLNRGKKIVQGEWDETEGAAKHMHGNAEEHIRVISGALTVSIWDTDGRKKIGHVKLTRANTKHVPYIIPTGACHEVTALEDNTKFSIEFNKS